MIGTPTPPAPAPTAGMSLWVKGSAGLFTTPDVWSDQSGNGYDLTGPGGAGQPVAGTGINSLATADFTPTPQYLETALGVTLAELVTADTFSVFAVFLYAGNSNKGGNLFTPPLLIDTSGEFAVFPFVNAGAGEIWASTVSHLNAGLVAGTYGKGSAVRASFLQAGVLVGGNQQSLGFSGGSTVVQDGIPIANLTGRLCVGTWVATGAGAFSGSIGEILIYPFALTGVQQAATEAYLDGVWGT